MDGWVFEREVTLLDSSYGKYKINLLKPLIEEMWK